MTRLCLLLCSKFLRAITAQFLHMGRQELGKHIQWREEAGKRLIFLLLLPNLPQSLLPPSQINSHITQINVPELKIVKN